MPSLRNRIGNALLSGFATLVCVGPALADDSEIYSNANTGADALRPNILFIVDTSGSMDTKDVYNERAVYQKGTTYTTKDNCVSNHIFYRAEGDDIPDCSSDHYILGDTTYQNCQKLSNGITGIAGRWTGKTAAYDNTAQIWRDLQPKGLSELVECSADSGIHGKNSSSTPNTYARNGDKTAPWAKDSSASIDWTQRKTYTFYSSNWLNWRRVTPQTQTQMRITAVQQAVIEMASSVDGVNLGLMRYSNNDPNTDADSSAQGGYIAAAVDDIDKNRENIISTVNGYTPKGYTPLAETLYEAIRYYSGKTVDYGNTSVPGKSVAASRTDGTDTGTTYKSPIIGQCQKNFVIYLTDGLPTQDRGVNGTRATNLLGASCQKSTDPADGRCLDDFAGYAHTHDLNSTLAGDQTVATYTIGFGGDVKGASLLTDVANAGGGKRFDASGTEELTEALTSITNDVLNVSTTFTTASVGVNAFNRTQTRSDLYFALFAPKETVRWEGNLKKFKLAVDKTDAAHPKLIITGQGTPTDAVDQGTGRFKDSSKSFWSKEVDGNDVTVGGAVDNLPAPAARKLLTFLAQNPAGTKQALVALNSTDVTSAILGTTTGVPTRDDLLAFAYSTEAKRMGDALHSQPSVVTYGGTATAPTDVVYVATNDGYLHAIDPADSSGVEKWAFIPRELLPRLRTLYNNESNPNRTYGLDGDVRIVRLDRNGDGKIDPTDGDAVWLFVGMRRGGKYIYALDVSYPDDPKMLWVDGADDPNGLGVTTLPGLGETWSSPTITRANVKGASQNNQKLVLIFGGGYDANQEGHDPDYKQPDDAEGNRVFMVDAKTGKMLWYATPDNTLGKGADKDKATVITDMKSSIPAPIAVIDYDGDLFADRMYVGDMGGRVFRFDITNGNTADKLVAGGVIAELGQGQVTTVANRKAADSRRFYNMPDVALISRRGQQPYYNIAIGSGYRGHPLDIQTADRFYTIRDYAPYMKLDAAAYSSYTRIKDSDLYDISGVFTDISKVKVPLDAKGWKLLLGTTGQKVLAPATTADGTVLFTTFEPRAPSATDPCRPQTLNRAYGLKVDDGLPSIDVNKDNKIDEKDVAQEVAMDGSILGRVVVGMLRGPLADDLRPKLPDDATDADKQRPIDDTFCMTGMHILGRCVNLDDQVRTYWSKEVDPPNETPTP